MENLDGSATTKGNYVPKAGKKTTYTPPPPANPENQQRREMGNQQFYCKEQLTVPATKMVLDKKTGRIVAKVYDAPVSFLWDKDRKHFIFSPPGKETNHDS